MKWYKQAYPLFNLTYLHPQKKQPGSATGIKMLLNGDLSFAESSRTLKPIELQFAQKKGFTLEEMAVAIDAITIFVNDGLPIHGLNLSQVKKIFTGEIKNWKDLGGPDLPITVFIHNQEASSDFFKNVVLHGNHFGLSQEVSPTELLIKKVAKTPGGVSFATTSEIVDQKTIPVKPLPLAFNKNGAFVPPFSGTNINKVNKQAFADGSYPITRKLYVIIKKDGGLDQQAGTAYANLLLSVEGQKLVEQAGFAPIRKFNHK